MTKDEAERLSNEDLMRLLASECGIYTTDQLKAFFKSLHRDTEHAMIIYGFGEWEQGGLILNSQGIIAAEVVDRFMTDNN